MANIKHPLPHATTTASAAARTGSTLRPGATTAAMADRASADRRAAGHPGSPGFAARIVRTSLLPAMLAIGLLYGCGSDGAESLAQSGRDYLAKRDYQAAVIQFKSALQEDPDNPELRYLLGSALRELGEGSAAAIELKKAAAGGYQPDTVYPALLLALLEGGQYDEVVTEGRRATVTSDAARATLLALQGEARLYSGNIDDASLLMRQALAADPSSAKAKLGLSKIAAARRELPEALRLVDEVLEATPDDASALFHKALLLQASGDVDGAKALYEKVVALRPVDKRAQFNLAMLLLEQGNLEGANTRVAAMKKAIPGLPVATYLDALIAYRKGEPTRARDLVREVLKVLPEYGPANALAGAIAHDMESYVEAEEYLTRALAAEPNSAYARRLMVSTYARTGQADKARAALAPLLRQAQPDLATLLLAGEVSGLSGDRKKAAEYFEKAASLDPKNVMARTRLGQLQLASGDTQGAIEDLEAASALDPTRSSADVALVRHYLGRKEYDKAMAAAEVVRRKQPENPLPYQLIGTVQLAKNDWPAARGSFERALQLQPSFLPAARSLAALDLQDGKLDAAIRRFEDVAKADPKQEAAWLALAQAKEQAGAPVDEVLALIDKAVSANPASSRAKLAKVTYLLQAGNVKGAVSVAQEAHAAHPSDPVALDALAGAQLRAGEVDQALANYGKLSAMTPKSGAPYVGIAGAHVARKEWGPAGDALRRAVQLQPDWLPAREAQVLLGIASQKYDEALEAARAIQKGWPKQPNGYIAESDVMVIQKRWPEAESVLRDAGRRVEDPAIAIKLYAVLEGQGKGAEADAMALGWATKHPGDASVAAAVGQGYLGRQDYAKAARWYREASRIQPKNPMLLNNLAWCLGELNDPAALEIGQRALASAPRSAPILDTVGMLYVKAGDPARGMELLRQAVELAPRSGSLRLNLARALIANGSKPEARKELEAISNLPGNDAAKQEASKLLATL